MSAERVVRLAFHLIAAVVDEVLQRDDALLRLTFNAPGIDVFLGDRDQRDILQAGGQRIAVWVIARRSAVSARCCGLNIYDGRACNRVEELLLFTDGIGFLRIQSERFHDQAVDLLVGLGLIHGFRHLRVAEQEFTVGRGQTARQFPIGGNRQHDVGVLGRGVQELCLGNNKIDLAVRFDALLHVRSALQIGVLVNIGDAVDVTLDVAAFADSLRGIAVIIADHVILACQDRIPDLRAGDDAGDTVVRGAGQSGAAALDQRVAAVGGVVGIAQCAAVAGLAHMAAHRAHGHDNLRDVLRAVVSR